MIDLKNQRTWKGKTGCKKGKRKSSKLFNHLLEKKKDIEWGSKRSGPSGWRNQSR